MVIYASAKHPNANEMKDMEVLIKSCMLASKATFFSSKFFNERKKRQLDEEKEEKEEEYHFPSPPLKKSKN